MRPGRNEVYYYTFIALPFVVFALNFILPSLSLSLTSFTQKLFVRADIWRYSVMYVYGGVYVDADAGFRKGLDEVLNISFNVPNGLL